MVYSVMFGYIMISHATTLWNAINCNVKGSTYLLSFIWYSSEKRALALNLHVTYHQKWNNANYSTGCNKQYPIELLLKPLQSFDW